MEGHEFKNFEFCTPSIFLLPLQGNAFKLVQMFTSGRRCTDDQTVQTQDSVTVEFHGISCTLHISLTLGRIFIILWANARLSWLMCRTHSPAMAIQGQIHS